MPSNTSNICHTTHGYQPGFFFRTLHLFLGRSVVRHMS
jgi:hypothetical protein